MKTIVPFFFTLTVLSLLFVSCKPDDVSVTLVKTFYSDAAIDGIIINSSPRQVKDYDTGSQGKRITIGWQANGNTMRGFLSGCKAMWNIFSGEESKWADYRPKLVIKYHHEK